MPILGKFREKYPGIQITMRTGNTETVVNSLFAYDADIGVLGEIPEGREFNTLKLNATPIIAFVARTHALAGQKSMSFADLSKHPLVLRERGSKTRQKLEAMASGLPVVGTRVNGIAEVVEHGCTGYLVPPRRPDLLADALGQLVDDPERASAF